MAQHRKDTQQLRQGNEGMLRSLGLGLLILHGAAVFPVSPAMAQEDDAGKQCDILAAGPYDQHRRANGVALKEIDSERAIAFCRAAYDDAPTTMRFAYQLARAYLSDRQLAEALEWFGKAADYEYKAAMHDFALLQIQHPSAPAYHQAAVLWLERAASQGYAPAQHLLGIVLFDGTEFVERDYVKARAWLLKAVDNGSQEAEYHLASMYDFGLGGREDKSESARLYERAANRGHLKARARLARHYMLGTGVPQDPERGRDLLDGLFGRTDGEAEFVMALFYSDTVRIGGNRDQLYDLLWSSAESGFGPAEDRLLRLYLVQFLLLELSGNALPGSRTTEEAIAWIEERAKAGNGVAAVILGNIYERGQGVPVDESKAIIWKTRAQELADKESAEAK